MSSKVYFLAITLYLTIFLGSCTTAVIDEVSVGGLDPIQRTILYDPDVQTIMFNNCVTCHGGPAPNAGVDLTTYDNVRFYTESGNLNQRMNDAASPMPPSGLLPAEQRQIIAKWIEDGFPEN